MDDLQPEPSRYNRVAIVLHWIMAAALLYQLALGFWMVELPKTPPGVRAEWFNWHKSVGIVLGLLVILRGAWRLTHQSPPLPQELPAWQVKAAFFNHVLLYICIVFLPLSGFLGSSFSPYAIKFFGTPLPRLWEASEDLKELCSEIHEATVAVFIAALCLHVLAAIWHSVRGQSVIRRMMP